MPEDFKVTYLRAKKEDEKVDDEVVRIESLNRTNALENPELDGCQTTLELNKKTKNLMMK
jgi:hypothetical protein